MVSDKIGFVIDKIELLAYQTSFDAVRRTGMIPVNISIFPEGSFKNAVKVMAGAFKNGLCVSDLVAVAYGGKTLGKCCDSGRHCRLCQCLQYCYKRFPAERRYPYGFKVRRAFADTA